MEKMRMSLSFKESEKYMWEHIRKQLNSSYYIKQLIHNDIYKLTTTTITSLQEQQGEGRGEDKQDFDLLAIEF